MFKTFSKDYLGQLYYGIEVIGLKDNQIDFKLTSLILKNRELNLHSFNDGQSFNKNTKKTIRAGLVINTEHVLSKVLKKPFNHIQQAVEQLFPNIDLKQFYYQSHEFKGQYLISVVRKTHVLQIVRNLEQQNIFINEIFLGNIIASSIEKISSLKNLVTSNAYINLGDGINVEKQKEIEPKQFKIQDIDVSNLFILSLLAAVNQSSIIIEVEDNFSEITNVSGKGYNHYLIFYYGIRAAVAILLLALMANFYYFNIYYDYVNNNPKIDNNILQTNYENLNKQVNNQDKLISQILQNKSSSTSYIINDIVKTLPTNTYLKEIAYQPLEKKIKKNKPIELKLNEIIIKGNTDDKFSFANWNTELEKSEWIENITIEKFNAIENSTKQQFEIKIQMKK